MEHSGHSTRSDSTGNIVVTVVVDDDNEASSSSCCTIRNAVDDDFDGSTTSSECSSSSSTTTTALAPVFDRLPGCFRTPTSFSSTDFLLSLGDADTDDADDDNDCCFRFLPRRLLLLLLLSLGLFLVAVISVFGCCCEFEWNTFMCDLSVLLCANERPQWGHAYGFSPFEFIQIKFI